MSNIRKIDNEAEFRAYLREMGAEEDQIEKAFESIDDDELDDDQTVEEVLYPFFVDTETEIIEE